MSSIQFDVGSWGLFCGPCGRQLALVDNTPCGPVSARKLACAVPRRLLLDEDRLARVFSDGTGVSETITHAGAEWAIELRPIRSPRTSTLIGVLAGVWPSTETVPDPPLIGSWEWEVELDGDGQTTAHKRTYWDQNLREIYAVDPAYARRSSDHLECGIWMSELVDRVDQVRLNASIRDGLQDGMMGVVGGFRCLTYNVVTGYGSPSPGRRHLRLVGQVVPVQPGDDMIIMQGFSYEAPPDFHDLALEHDAARVDDVLRGVMELSKEPLAVLDVSTLAVLMTTQAWRQQGLHHTGEFTVDDPCGLHEFIMAAAEDTENAHSRAIRVIRFDGSLRPARITVIGVRSGFHGQDAAVRVDL